MPLCCFTSWQVICSKCGKEKWIRGHPEHKGAAFREFHQQGWEARWEEGKIKIYDAAYWLCPKCKGK